MHADRVGRVVDDGGRCIAPGTRDGRLSQSVASFYPRRRVVITSCNHSLSRSTALSTSYASSSQPTSSSSSSNESVSVTTQRRPPPSPPAMHDANCSLSRSIPVVLVSSKRSNSTNPTTSGPPGQPADGAPRPLMSSSECHRRRVVVLQSSTSIYPMTLSRACAPQERLRDDGVVVRY